MIIKCAKYRVVSTKAWLAQSVEHETLNLRVVGSSPTLGYQFFPLLLSNAVVAPFFGHYCTALALARASEKSFQLIAKCTFGGLCKAARKK
jgi:hypothetical protein